MRERAVQLPFTVFITCVENSTLWTKSHYKITANQILCTRIEVVHGSDNESSSEGLLGEKRSILYKDTKPNGYTWGMVPFLLWMTF